MSKTITLPVKGGPALLEDPVVQKVEQAGLDLRRQKRTQNYLFWAGFFITLGISVYVGEFYPQNLIEVPPRVFNYIYKVLPKMAWATLFSDIAEWYWNFAHWLKLLLDTVLMAVYATLFGTTAAFLLSFAASRNLMPITWIYVVSRRFMEVSRTVPELVFALVFVWAFGLGPMAGVLAISVHTFGTLGKLFSEINENIDMDPVRGVRATGANWFQAMRFAVVPQVLPNYASYSLLRFEINVRAASVLGFVGAGGIGMEFYHVIKQFFYEDISAIALMLVVTVGVIDTLSEKLRHRLIGTMDMGVA